MTILRLKELPIEVTLTVKGSDIHVDLTGTAPQTPNKPINMPLVGTVDCAVWLTLRSILLDSDSLWPDPAEQRVDPADHDLRARRVSGQPDLSRPRHRPLLPGQRRRRHGDEGDCAGRAADR